MNRIYCNKCKKDITNEPYLNVGTDWENSKYMERYEPRGIHLCEEHAMEFIDETLDEDGYDRYLKYKAEYEASSNRAPETVDTIPCPPY